MIEFVQSTITAIGYVGVAFLTFLENIFPPIPSEIVIPFAGFAAKRDQLTLLGVIIAGSVGTVIGALPLYYLGYFLGEERLMRLADRYGKWLTVSGEDIQKANRWLNEHGTLAVFICRMVPGVRSFISIPAGIAKMNMPIFLVYTTAGTALWTALLAILGYWLGANYQAISPYMDVIGWLVGIGLVVWFAVWVYQRRRNQQQETRSP